MARRALPALLVAAAAAADAGRFHDLGLYALLGAIAAVALAALAAFGEVLDGEAGASQQLQAVLWCVALVLVVGGATARSPAVRDGDLPAFASTALLACLVVLALEAVVGAGRAAVERPERPRRDVPADELRRAA